MSDIEEDGVLDMWREGLGTPHYLYVLDDPRTNEVCYIGVTKQGLKKRLMQHRNPKATNMASIAKLQRHLKEIGMTLQGRVIAKGSERFIYVMEAWMITGTNLYLGKNKLKNHLLGGKSNFGADEVSKFKARETQRKNLAEGKTRTRKGEEIGNSKLDEETILNIYSLIKSFKSNQEIIDELSLTVGNTGLHAIRKGQNWCHLFERERMEFIPSIKAQNGNMSAVDKFKVLEDIEKGMEVADLKLKYSLQTTDVKRIKDRILWGPVWKIYEKFYKKQQNKQ